MIRYELKDKHRQAEYVDLFARRGADFIAELNVVLQATQDKDFWRFDLEDIAVTIRREETEALSAFDPDGWNDFSAPIPNKYLEETFVVLPFSSYAFVCKGKHLVVEKERESHGYFIRENTLREMRQRETPSMNSAEAPLLISPVVHRKTQFADVTDAEIERRLNEFLTRPNRKMQITIGHCVGVHAWKVGDGNQQTIKAYYYYRHTNGRRWQRYKSVFSCTVDEAREWAKKIESALAKEGANKNELRH